MMLKIKIIQLFIIILSFQNIVFSQKDTIKAPPLPPLPKTSWDRLNDHDKSLLTNSRKFLSEIQSESDSLLRTLTNYLVEENKKNRLTNYQVTEVSKLIYRIPGDKGLKFILYNIDLEVEGAVGGIHAQMSNYPFLNLIISQDNRQSRLFEIIGLIFSTELLNNCEINGIKLMCYRSMLEYYANYAPESAEELLNFYLRREEKECKKVNIKRMISKRYSNFSGSKLIDLNYE